MGNEQDFDIDGEWDTPGTPPLPERVESIAPDASDIDAAWDDSPSPAPAKAEAPDEAIRQMPSRPRQTPREGETSRGHRRATHPSKKDRRKLERERRAHQRHRKQERKAKRRAQHEAERRERRERTQAEAQVQEALRREIEQEKAERRKRATAKQRATQPSRPADSENPGLLPHSKSSTAERRRADHAEPASKPSRRFAITTRDVVAGLLLLLVALAVFLLARR
jgi:cobalamin biosynthesis Mg chelatase CobN